MILQSGTLNLQSIVEQQSGHLGITGWNLIWVQPVGFIVYLIAAIAETNRVPFDLPEAETELVAGFHTEYSAMKFALFFLAEYVNMFTVSMLATTLFLGGRNGPFVHQLPWLGVFYFLGKVIFFLFFYIWLRGTLPRFRFDQLMGLAWKVLLPLLLGNLVAVLLVKQFGWHPIVLLPISFALSSACRYRASSSLERSWPMGVRRPCPGPGPAGPTMSIRRTSSASSCA